MALAGSQVKPVITNKETGGGAVPVGVVASIKNTVSTQSISVKGLNGVTLERVGQHTYEWGWEGFATTHELLTMGLPLTSGDNAGLPPKLEVLLGGLQMNDAYVSKMNINGSEGNPLKYSLEGVFKTGEAKAQGSYTAPAHFFVYSDAVVSFGSETGIIKSFDLNVSRNIEGVYGTELDPQDFNIGSTEYTGKFEIAADDLVDVLEGAWIATDTPITFTITYTMPYEVGGTTPKIVISGTGALVNSADAQVDPESNLVIAKNIKFSGLTIGTGS